MTAFAGCWQLQADRSGSEFLCCAEALTRHNTGPIQHRRDGSLTLLFGSDDDRGEESTDNSPIKESGEELIVAVVRVDNRADIISRLRIQGADASRLSDAAILAHCWTRWRLRCFDYLVADCVFAVWHKAAEQLILVRSPMASATLYWRKSTASVQFASELNPILQAARERAAPDIDTLLELYSTNDVFVGSRTVFAGLSSVPVGRALTFERGSEPRESRLWEPGHAGVPCPDLPSAARELRCLFDAATEARLRRDHGRVASELSSGRDSNAVTASAARLLADRGEGLIALTGVPVEEYEDDLGQQLRGNEGPLASVAAANHSNIEHVLCRSRRDGLLDYLDDYHCTAAAPMRGLNNLPWQRTVMAEAAKRGVSICLRGGHGNWTISAGGQLMLSDVLCEGGGAATLRSAHRYARADGRLWWNVLHYLIGPSLPRSTYAALLGLRGHSLSVRPAPFLKRKYRLQVEQFRKQQEQDQRPARRYKDRIRDYFADRAENVNFFAKAARVIEMRDPTSDRRVVDHILAQPAEFFLSQKDRRPLYEAAFGDLIPAEVMYARPIGMPGEDWNFVYHPKELQRALTRYSSNKLVAEMIDLQSADEALGCWPKHTASAEEYQVYVQELLNTVSLASFIAVRFPT